MLTLPPTCTGVCSRGPSPAGTVAACWLAVPASLALAACIVPVSYEPFWGWLLFYEWTAACFCLSVGFQLRARLFAGGRTLLLCPMLESCCC